MSRRISFIALLSCLCALRAFALDISAGTYMFDNTKTKYDTVFFVYGVNGTSQTRIIHMERMPDVDGVWWMALQPEYNVYRYTFVGGPLTDGYEGMSFSDFKDYVSHTLGYDRTATTDAEMRDGGIFVPETGDNWTQGYWMWYWDWLNGDITQSAKADISGTLPVIYINTVNGVAVDSKEEYRDASLYLVPTNTGFPALGSESEPITMHIKGRGNWTWNGFDKKPYKIKFDVKQAMLGMPNNKHWCLLAHADDYLGFLKNTTGFCLSEAVGMRYTPRFQPVELVLNGKYQGLYFLTESVRIAGNRVHITEQENNATDSVSGGWLVEIDNYDEPDNIVVQEGNGEYVRITLQEPEKLSSAQRNYIENQMNGLNNAIWGSSFSDLNNRLDLDEAAKFYLVQEIMEDCESYHGSCFLYKDRDRNGVVDKWKFGPVWDFGNAYDRHNWGGPETWIYDSPSFAQYWIGQLATWPEFQKKTKENWYVFYHDKKDQVLAQLTTFVNTIAQAAKNDAEVWKNTSNYRDNSDIQSKKDQFFSYFNWRVNWLYSQWGEGIKPATYDVELTKDPSQKTYKVLRNGQVLILRNGRTYDVTGRLVE